MRSDQTKKSIEKAPHRSLLKACGLTDEEIARPIVGIVNSAKRRSSPATSICARSQTP